jgi:hypothetical protein
MRNTRKEQMFSAVPRAFVTARRVEKSRKAPADRGGAMDCFAEPVIGRAFARNDDPIDTPRHRGITVFINPLLTIHRAKIAG